MWRAAARAVAKTPLRLISIAVPPLVGVPFECTVLDPWPLATRPATQEADTRIDARVRKRDRPAACFRGLVDRAIERRVIRHVRDRATHVEALVL